MCKSTRCITENLGYQCDECGAHLSSIDAAQVHGTRTGHAQFSEVQGIAKAPLTPEEKAAKLIAIQEKIKARREERKREELQELKNREQLRRKSGQELIQIQGKHHM
jgi:hypothetical protein